MQRRHVPSFTKKKWTAIVTVPLVCFVGEADLVSNLPLKISTCSTLSNRITFSKRYNYMLCDPLHRKYSAAYAFVNCLRYTEHSCIRS